MGVLSIPVSQYDVGRIISIGLINDGIPYKIPDDTSVYLKALKPDGTQINTDSCCSIHKNKIKIEVFKQLSIVSGTVKCELILSDKDSTLTTSKFNIVVQKSVHDNDNLKSTDEYKNIVELLAEISELKDTLVFKTDKDTANGIPSLDNNTKIPRNELYEADLDEKGIVKLVDSVESTSTTDAATPAAVKKAYDKSYSKEEIDNKFSSLETNIDWKETVDTYDDIFETYPEPQDGWTVNVKDTDYTYRYSGEKWVPISANAIPKATEKNDGLITKEQVSDLHKHNNKSTLDKIGESKQGVFLFNGKEIQGGGGSSSIAAVHGDSISVTDSIESKMIIHWEDASEFMITITCGDKIRSYTIPANTKPPMVINAFLSSNSSPMTIASTPSVNLDIHYAVNMIGKYLLDSYALFLSHFRLVRTLKMGTETITFYDYRIQESSTVDVYTSKYGIPTERVLIEDGMVAITFDALDEDIDVQIIVTNEYGFSGNFIPEPNFSFNADTGCLVFENIDEEDIPKFEMDFESSCLLYESDKFEFNINDEGYLEWRIKHE